MVPFKDISRLTIGLAYIFCQRVSSLLGRNTIHDTFFLILFYCIVVLDDTKHLLQKMERTNFEFDLPETFPTLLSTQANRKRKHIIATTTTTKTVCVTKRTKISAPHLPDEESVDYYKNILGDSLSWTMHNDILRVEEENQVNYYLFLKPRLTSISLSNSTISPKRNILVSQKSLLAFKNR